MADTVLHITGRDVEEQALAMKFENGVWKILGDAAKFCMSSNQTKIIATLKGGAMGPKAIAVKTKLPLDSVKKHVKKLVSDGHVKHLGHGQYELPSSSLCP